MKWKIFLGICLVLLIQSAYANCEMLNQQAIQNMLEKERARFHIPGLSVSIRCPGEKSPIDFVSGMTDLSGETKLTAHHLFQMGSITKSFTAVILLQLEAEGKLSLEDKINHWLPQKNAQWENITIKQLLNHTSGIYNYTDHFDEQMKKHQKIEINKQWPTDKLIEIAAQHPLYFKEGTDWHYSNTNYAIAAKIIEAVAGKPLTELMQTRIFSPLNLKHTYYLPNKIQADVVQQMADDYSKDVAEFNLSWANAGGSIVSTPHDIAIWWSNLVHGKLLPEKQMNELRTMIPIHHFSLFPFKHAHYGLGIIHNSNFLGSESWWHSGGMLGYSSLVAWLKEKDIVISLTANHMTKTRDINVIAQDLATYINSVKV